MDSQSTVEEKKQNKSDIQLDIKVLIKEDLKKGLIFGLSFRPPIVIILGFTGYSQEVLPIMQTLSHSTRAYIVNADSLRSFLAAFNIIKHLESADKAGQLKDAYERQQIDLDTVQKQLEPRLDNK